MINEKEREEFTKEDYDELIKLLRSSIEGSNYYDRLFETAAYVVAFYPYYDEPFFEELDANDWFGSPLEDTYTKPFHTVGTHFGDPCVYCGIAHDDVPTGPCSGNIVTWYITFGQSHVHSVNGKTFDKDCVGVITGKTTYECDALAFELFKGKFHKHSASIPPMQFYPRGFIKVN